MDFEAPTKEIADLWVRGLIVVCTRYAQWKNGSSATPRK